MKKPDNWENTKAAGEFQRPTAGGYVCRITKVTDVPDKEYLAIEYDICEGEFKGYGKETLERAGFTPFHFIKSYKQKALSFFKAFTDAVEQTNNGFTFAWDERTLVGKGIGLVLGEEEYQKRDGGVGVRLVPVAFKTANEIRNGEFTVPERKTIAPSASTFTDIADDEGELPF